MDFLLTSACHRGRYFISRSLIYHVMAKWAPTSQSILPTQGQSTVLSCNLCNLLRKQDNKKYQMDIGFLITIYYASVPWLLFFVIRFFHCTCVSAGFNFIDICCLSTSYIPAQKNEKIANFTKGKIFWVKNFQVCETFAGHIRLVFSRYKALPHWPSTKCFECN